jgi:hypothetical protein
MQRASRILIAKAARRCWSGLRREIVRVEIVRMAVGAVDVPAAVVEVVDAVGAAVDETDAVDLVAAAVEGTKDFSPRIYADSHG